MGYSDLIVTLWFFPVILQIILPLLLLILWPAVKFLGTLTEKTVQKTSRLGQKDKRLSTRVNVENSSVKISHNFERITGKISNVSLSGICIYGLPEEKLKNSNKFFLRLNNEGKPFSVLVKTKWQYTQQSGKIIGAKVYDAPPGWAEFITKATE